MHCGAGKHPGQSCHTGPVRPHSASCACGCGTHTWRRFQTQEEMVGRLECYLEDLHREAQAVKERIAALKDE
jgi:hypothetical protein